MSHSHSLPEEIVSDRFNLVFDSKGNLRDNCCSEYFTICGGCDGKPVELKLCDYEAVCLTGTPFFYYCHDERGCKYPPNVNSNLTFFMDKKICKCEDTLGWRFLVYPPDCAQVVNICAELVRARCEPCDPCKSGRKHNKHGH